MVKNTVKKKEQNAPKLPTVHLIGDSEENFYQLGLKDHELGINLHKEVKGLIHSRSPVVDRLIHLGTKEYLKRNVFQNPNEFKNLRAYAEGMKMDFFDLAHVMMVPELVSSMSAWLKVPAPKLVGCSTLFHLDRNDDLIHHRILDFPLLGPYDKNERAVLYEFKNKAKILGFGTSGMPYPSITMMNEHGVTLALHQKFSNFINTQGMPIFELAYRLMENCKTSDDLFSYLKNEQSFTIWCFNMAFQKEKLAVSVDIMGDKQEFIKTEMNKGDYVYYDNDLLLKSLPQKNFIPHGFGDYNEQRRWTMHEKIKKSKLDNPHFFDDAETVFKAFTAPLKNSSHRFILDHVTPSSIQIVSMNPIKESFLYIAGDAPKVLQQNLISISDVFHHPKEVSVHVKEKTCTEFIEGNRALMTAQKALDHGRVVDAYHELQMAMDHFTKSKSHSNYKYIAKFYFIVLQFLHDDHQKVRVTLKEEFKTLLVHLPQYLQDHCYLFIARINRLTDGQYQIEEDLIQNENLKKILDTESLIPQLIYWKILKFIILPRIDIVDIIHAHAKNTTIS